MTGKLPAFHIFSGWTARASQSPSCLAPRDTLPHGYCSGELYTLAPTQWIKGGGSKVSCQVHLPQSYYLQSSFPRAANVTWPNHCCHSTSGPTLKSSPEAWKLTSKTDKVQITTLPRHWQRKGRVDSGFYPRKGGRHH